MVPSASRQQVRPMAFIVGALGVLGAVYYWMSRARGAADMADDVADMAQSVTGAARRWNFRRQTDQHPIDCIEEQNLALGGLAVAFMELGGRPTAEDEATMHVALRSKLRISAEDADELAILGRWFIQQCPTTEAAFARLGRKLKLLTGPRGSLHIGAILDHMIENGRRPSSRQTDALDELDRLFRP